VRGGSPGEGGWLGRGGVGGLRGAWGETSIAAHAVGVMALVVHVVAPFSEQLCGVEGHKSALPVERSRRPVTYMHQAGGCLRPTNQCREDRIRGTGCCGGGSLLIVLSSLAAAGQPEIPWRTEYVMELGRLHDQGHPICEPMPDQLKGLYGALGKTGHRLRIRDSLAWRSTDALQAAQALDGLSGWITDLEKGGPVIHWVRDDGQGPQSLYEARLVDDEVVWTRGPGAAPTALPAHLRTAWSCRQLVLGKLTTGELQSPHPLPNPIVETIGETTYVFLTPPQADDKGQYMGGVVSVYCEDGALREASWSTPQMVTLPLDSSLASLRGVLPSPLEAPTPGQFFQVLLHGHPAYVQAQGHAWYITVGEEDHYLGALPPNQAAAKKRLKKLAKTKKTNQHPH